MLRVYSNEKGDGQMIGGILGLIGVLITLVYSAKLNKENNDSQREMNQRNIDFQEKLNKENQEFQEELAKKEEEAKLWRNKYNILIELISYRFEFGSKEYQAAMNSIPAVFHDSHEVMQAVRRFYEYASLPPNQKNVVTANEKMVQVYTAIFKDLDIDQNVDEVFLEKTFHA